MPSPENRPCHNSASGAARVGLRMQAAAQQKLTTIRLEQLQACMRGSLCLASKVLHHHLGSPGQAKGHSHAARLLAYLD